MHDLHMDTVAQYVWAWLDDPITFMITGAMMVGISVLILIITAFWPDKGPAKHVITFMASQPVRAYVYGILVPGSALAVAVGWISETTVPMLIALFAAILVPGELAASAVVAKTKLKKEGGEDK